MAQKRNPFESFKNLPFPDENFLGKLPQIGEKFLKNLPHFDADFIKELTGIEIPHGSTQAVKWPPVNLTETGKDIILTAEIPGLNKSSRIAMEFKGNTLEFSGEILTEPESAGESRVHQQERQTGKFSRTITLPAAVNHKMAKATYRRGILEIRLPKLYEGRTQTLNIDFY